MTPTYYNKHITKTVSNKWKAQKLISVDKLPLGIFMEDEMLW